MYIFFLNRLDDYNNNIKKMPGNVSIAASSYQQRLTQPIQKTLNNFTQQHVLNNKLTTTNNTFGTLQVNFLVNLFFILLKLIIIIFIV